MDTPVPTPLAEAAASMHEMFLALLAAGFTRADALTLISNVMANAVESAQSGDGSNAD